MSQDRDIWLKIQSLVGEFAPGTVSLVGAGPGDSTLVTMRGAIRITQADVILHDKLVGPELLELANPRAKRIFVGKWRGEHPWTQDQINAALIEHARAGKRVVRLKGGDPLVFGRGGEECEILAKAGIRFEIVPGITAAFGAPAYAGIPLTHRNLSRSFALVSGHADPDAAVTLDFDALARMETIAFYMGVKHLEANCRRLIEAGLDAATPAAVIEWGTRPQQRTVVGTVSDIAKRVAAEQIAPPSLVLIGKVVTMREQMNWFESDAASRPLRGQVVVVTRARDQASTLSSLLVSAGAEVIEAPTIEIAPLSDYSQIDAALRDVKRYAWLILTSTNGVDALFARLQALNLDSRALAGVHVAAVGDVTAERLASSGIKADLIASDAVGEVLGRELVAAGIKSSRVLLLRGDLASEALPAMLAASGAVCDDLPVYRTQRPQEIPHTLDDALNAGRVNWITLASSSAFINLLEWLGPSAPDRLRGVKLASIGPVTTRAIRERGFEVSVEAKTHDVQGLVDAMIRG